MQALLSSTLGLFFTYDVEKYFGVKQSLREVQVLTVSSEVHLGT